MAVSLSTVAVRLEAQGMPQVRGAFNDLNRDVSRAGSSIGKLMSPMAAVKGLMAGVVAGFAVKMAAGFLRSAIDEARDAQDKLAQLRVAVDNAGGDFEKLRPKLDAAADGL